MDASTAAPTPTRLRALVDAGVAVTSELSLDAVLQRLIEVAAQLTGARYAALGVIDDSGSQLERFLTHGIDADTRAAIGEAPRGRGILGALIREAEALRLDDLGQDSRSVGFPPHHPPMRSFLGVPVLLRGVAYGNLYLTEKAAGETFSHEDQELISLLAAQAAVAIENARLYEAATRWSRQLESLHEVGNALASEDDLDRLLEVVVSGLQDLLNARIVALALPADRDQLYIAAAVGHGTSGLVGQTLPIDGSRSGRVLQHSRSERVDSVLDDPEVNREMTRRVSARTGVWVPLIAQDRTIGVIVAHDKLGADARFADDDLRLAEIFAARAAAALNLAERITRDAYRRVVEAQEAERKRLARELHDETGQALTSILLGLKGVQATLDERDDAYAATSALRELVVRTLHDVRHLAVELRPQALDDFGLVPALERLTASFAEHTGLVVDFESALPDERLPTDVETALFRIVQESLLNVVKHASARTVSISLARRGELVAAVVEDDGVGFATSNAHQGSFGLIGMRERAALLGGRLDVESRPGEGTTVAAEVPLR